MSDPRATVATLRARLPLAHALAVPSAHMDASAQLRKAAASGDVAGIEAALNDDADIDAVDDRGMTALMLAAQQGQEDAARALLKHGPDLSPRAQDGWRALTYASANTFARPDGSRTDVLSLLLDAGDRPGPDDWKALHYAAEWGNDGNVAALVRAGMDPDTRDPDGLTALMRAARKSKAACVDALLAAGAGAELTDGAGRTALMYAAERANVDQVRALVAAGGDPAKKDVEGRGALDRAAGKPKILVALGGS